MSLTEIVFWLFARLRPLLWYYHRLGRLLAVAVFCLEDEESLFWLVDNPRARADFESKLADGEHVLDIVVGLRAREILGLAAPIVGRPGIARCARIHSAASVEHLAARLIQLVQRYTDIERLARLRASRIRREIEAVPVLLVAEHRPQATIPGLSSFFATRFVVFSRPLVAIPAGLRIRAPP